MVIINSISLSVVQAQPVLVYILIIVILAIGTLAWYNCKGHMAYSKLAPIVIGN